MTVHDGTQPIPFSGVLIRVSRSQGQPLALGLEESSDVGIDEPDHGKPSAGDEQLQTRDEKGESRVDGQQQIDRPSASTGSTAATIRAMRTFATDKRAYLHVCDRIDEWAGALEVSTMSDANRFLNAARLNHDVSAAHITPFDDCQWSTCREARETVSALTGDGPLQPSDSAVDPARGGSTPGATRAPDVPETTAPAREGSGQHTPLPWHREEQMLPLDDLPHVVVVSADGVLLHDCGLAGNRGAEANAAFVVTACNAYDALVAQREAFAEWLEEMRAEMSNELFIAGNHPALGVDREMVERWYRRIQALLAKAGA